MTDRDGPTRSVQPSDLLILPRGLVIDATDSALVGEQVRLYEAADASWPYPAHVPRWVDTDRLAQLVADGQVVLDGHDRYTVPAVEWNRQRQAEWGRAGGHVGGRLRAETAARDAGGRFTSTQSQPEAPLGQPDPPLVHPEATRGGSADGDGDADGEDDGDGRHARERAREAGGGPEGLSIEEAYRRIVGREASREVARWLRELAGRYGTGTAAAALADEHGENADRTTLIGRVRERLARAAEDAVARKRNADVLRQMDQRRAEWSRMGYGPDGRLLSAASAEEDKP